jgi:hypothetical protein
VKITLEFEVEPHILRDALVTAVEGGSNYWATFAGIKRDDEGNILEVVVAEQESSKEGRNPLAMVVTPEKLVTGLQRLANAQFPNAQPALGRILREEGDAIDADIVLQMTILGDVVYG